MPSRAHEDGVQRLLDAGADTGNFNLKMAWAIRHGNTDYPKRWTISDPLVAEIRSANRKIPDAFVIDCARKFVSIREFVVASDCDPTSYLDLWFFLDCEEWDMELQVHSRHGGHGVYAADSFSVDYAAMVCGRVA